MYRMYCVCYDTRVVVDGNRNSTAYAEVAPSFFKDMRHGEERHGQIRVFDGVKHLYVLFDSGIIIGVGDNHAFRLTGGSGSVYQGGHVVGKSSTCTGFDFSGDFLGSVHAETHEIVPEDRHRIVIEKLQPVILEDNNLFDLWVSLPVSVSHGILMLVSHKQNLGSSVTDYEIKLRLDTACVNGNAGYTVTESSELGDEYLRSVGRTYSYSVFLDKSQRSEGFCSHINLDCELRPGGREPFAILSPAETVGFMISEPTCLGRYYFD